MQVSTRWHRQSYKQWPAIAGRSDVEEDGDGDEDEDDEVTRMKTVSDTIWRALILMAKPQTLDSIQEGNHVNIYLLAYGSGCDCYTHEFAVAEGCCKRQ